MKYVSLFTIPFVVSVESTSFHGIDARLGEAKNGGAGHKINFKSILDVHGEKQQDRNLEGEEQWYEVGNGMGTQDDNERDRKTGMGYAVASSASGNIVAVSSPRQAMGDITVGLDMMDLEEINEFDSDPDRPGINVSKQYYPRVQLFEFNPQNDQWEKFSADIETNDPVDEFGVALAMDAAGSTLVVGALDGSQFGKMDAGSVTIYKFDRIRKIWLPKGTNHRIEGSAPFDKFGSAVDISDDGNVIAVGAPNKDIILQGDADAYADAFEHRLAQGGEVRVYKYHPEENQWNLMGTPIRGEMFDRLGSSVSIASQELENNLKMYILAAGAPTAGMYEAGYVQIFRRMDDNVTHTDKDWTTNLWTSNVEAKIMGDADGDHFGSSVALNKNGTVFIAGAPHHRAFTLKKKSGHALVYKVEDNDSDSDSNNGNVWRQMYHSLVGLNEGDECGHSVAISPDGDRVAVGSPFSSKPSSNGDGNGNVNGKHSGHVSMYDAEQGYDQSFWGQMHLDTYIDGDHDGDNTSTSTSRNTHAMDLTGTSIAMAMNGNRIVVGSPGGGYVRVYEYHRTAPPTTAPTSDVRVGSAPGGGGSYSDLSKEEREREEEVFRDVTMEILILVFALLLPLLLMILILALKQIRYVLSGRTNNGNELVPGTDTDTNANTNTNTDSPRPAQEVNGHEGEFV